MVKMINEHPTATFKFNVGTRQSEFQKQKAELRINKLVPNWGYIHRS